MLLKLKEKMKWIYLMVLTPKTWNLLKMKVMKNLKPEKKRKKKVNLKILLIKIKKMTLNINYTNINHL